MLASDENNPNFVGAKNPDGALFVEFYNRPVQNPFKTEKEQRPVFEDHVYVKIFTPGSQLNVIDTPAREHHKNRFPMQWARFKNSHGEDGKTIGTPIEQWPLVTASQAEMLKAMNFRTVEAVAGSSDEQISRIGMVAGMAPLAFRERAQRFLDSAHIAAEANEQAEEIKKRDDLLAQQAAMLQELQQRLEALEKPKRKYTRKSKEEATT